MAYKKRIGKEPTPPAPTEELEPLDSKPKFATINQLREICKFVGVDLEDVMEMPKITPILQRLHGGGLQRAVEFLFGSSTEEARNFSRLYAFAITDPDLANYIARDLVPFEVWCVKLQLTSTRMLEVITGACFEQSSQASSLIAAASHPAVVQATVDSALLPWGGSDRKVLHSHVGFTPVPKGTVIFSGNSQQTNIGPGSKITKISVNELPAIDAAMARISDRFNEKLGLGSGQLPPSDRDRFADEVIEIAAEPIDE